jgi:hypothetical protein
MILPASPSNPVARVLCPVTRLHAAIPEFSNAKNQPLSFHAITNYPSSNPFALFKLQTTILKPFSFHAITNHPRGGGSLPTCQKILFGQIFNLPFAGRWSQVAGQRPRATPPVLLPRRPLSATIPLIRETSPLLPVSNQVSGRQVAQATWRAVAALRSLRAVVRAMCRVALPAGAGKAHRVRLG